MTTDKTDWQTEMTATGDPTLVTKVNSPETNGKVSLKSKAPVAETQFPEPNNSWPKLEPDIGKEHHSPFAD